MKPVVKLLALPVVILTLGIALFFVNLLMLYVTSWIVPGFELQFVHGCDLGDARGHGRQLGRCTQFFGLGGKR